MTEIDKKIKDQEKIFLDKVTATLDSAAEDLDTITRTRLRGLRREALASADMKDSQKWWVPATSLATVAILLVLTASLWTLSPDENSLLHSPEDIALLSGQEGPELYENLDFYLWLDSKQLKSEKTFNEQKTG
jgi:hypothetical protein